MKKYTPNIRPVTRWLLVLLVVQYGAVFATDEQRRSIEKIYISVDFREMALEDAFNQLTQETEFNFHYSLTDIADKKVSVRMQNASLGDLLRFISAETGLYFERIRETIHVLPKGNRKKAVIDKLSGGPQMHPIRGRVVDEDGSGLPGVNIIVKGTSRGTVTDVDGNYQLEIESPNAVLVFTFVGYAPQEVEVGERTIVDITLSPDIATLEEIVVVGYGTQKKVNLTGAVDAVTARDVDWKPVGQTSMALQGVAPGVTITQNSGQPGKDAGTIRIRGIGTLGTAGQEPLVLVDGVESSLNNVDPADIESISILKDAASASIYGSRAANGVIVVTTKRAESKRITVSYGGFVGWQRPTDMPELVSGLDHMLLLNEANQNMGQSPTFQESYIEEYRQNAPSDLYPDTDWKALTLTENGLMQSHALDVAGGSDAIRIRASYNRFEQGGLIPNTGYNRNTLRINTDIKASEKLNFRIDLRGTDELQFEPAVGVNNIFYHVNGRVPRNQEGVLSDGRYGQGWLGSNPVSFANASGTADDRTYSAILNFQANWTPIKGMNVNVMYAPEYYSSVLKRFTHSIQTYYGDGREAYRNPNMSDLLHQNRSTRTDNVRALLNYDKTINDHNVGVLLGFEQISTSYESFQGRRENFPLENYQLLSLGSEINQQADGSAYDYALRSYFGRVNYSYKNRYLFEANLRYDGSSRFADGQKFGVFPSFSAGWRLIEEDFLRDSDFLGDLKLRASWGRLGNQNIGNYPFASSVSLTQTYILNEVAVPGAALLQLGNSDISWETTEMINAGVDVEFLGKFSLTADYYVKDTKDILLNLPIPLTVGQTPPYQNAGKVRNTGWDVSLAHFNQTGGFNYRVAVALSDVKNEIIDLHGTGPYIGERTIRMEGYPIDAFYGYQTDGLFQSSDEVAAHATQFGGQVSAGDIKYVNQNDDNIINADGDRVVLGSAIPRYTYSLNLSGSFKGFDVNMFFQGVGKADGYRDGSGVWAFYVGATALKQHLDRWTPENPNASYPRLTFGYPNNEQVSDYWLLNAAYLRMKNLQVGYSFPHALINKLSLNHLRLYVGGQNLFTIDKFLDGHDVEAPMGSSGYYPMVKTYTVGINAKF